jgi:hypothetical protein
MTRLMQAGFVLAVCAALVGAATTASAGSAVDGRAPSGASPFEVWTIDQQDSRPGSGGFLHVFDGEDLMGDPARARSEILDLGGEARDLCLARTGAAPQRPHMLVFNGGDGEGPESATHAAIAFVVSGHVLILDAASRKPLECLRTSPGEAGRRQAHAVWPTPDQRHLIVANQNGKRLERIRTDYANNRFELEDDAALSLYTGTTPSGAPRQDPALRPDNAPICPRTDSANGVTFTSLRGGGMFVVDHNATPMRIVAEYDRDHVDDNGCGQVEANGKMYVNSGAGAPGDPSGHDVYAFDLSGFGSAPTAPNTPAPRLVYSRDAEGQVDAHAVGLTRHGRYLWWGDRVKNDVTVVDPETDDVVGSFSLAGQHSDDPAPDLFDLSPSGNRMFASFRGPAPASGGHDAVGSTPGIGVIQVVDGGRSGQVKGVAPIRRADQTPPDPHAIRVRPVG